MTTQNANMTDFAYRITNPNSGEVIVASVRIRDGAVHLKCNDGRRLKWTHSHWKQACEDLDVEAIGILS